MAKKRGASKLGLIGCGFVAVGTLCCGGPIAGLVVGVMATLKTSAPYQEAMILVHENPALNDELGSPIEAGWLVMGSVSTSGATGEADLEWGIEGPDGTGTVYCTARKSGGQWSYTQLIAWVDESGDMIDLLGVRVLDQGEVTAATSFVGKGRHHLRNQRWDQAYTEFDRALGLDDENGDAWHGRGEAALERGEIDAAVHDLKRASARKPGDIDVHMTLGRAMNAAEDWSGCIDAYTEVLYSEPETAEAWYLRARCFESNGETRKAIAGAREACNRDHVDACAMATRLGGGGR